MGKLKVLILGDGLLGKELINQSKWDYVSRKKDKLDITNIKHLENIISNYNVVVNCIANTNTYSNDKEKHWEINYKFVYDLINICNSKDIKLIHISTTYLYDGSVPNASEEDVPVHSANWYGYTKLLGDGLVQLLSNDYLICRCTHKPKPFPYDSAWIDQVGNFDYVDKISKIMIDLINDNRTGIYNVGTELKTMYELAKETKEDVKPTFAPQKAPKNISTNMDKLNSLQPFFSIAIPAYGYAGKGKEFLDHNFKSLHKQTFKDFEVVVSDHSTDDTIKDLCESWRDKLKIRYIRNERGRGIISPNLNEALKNSSGKWIKMLFQDDYMYDEKSLEATKNFIDERPDINWMATKFCHSNDGVSTYRIMFPKWNDQLVYGQNGMGCPSVIAIKNENIMYFDEELNWLMDCEYYKRMYDKYGEAPVLDQLTVVNRTNPERLTNSMPESRKLMEYQKMRARYG